MATVRERENILSIRHIARAAGLNPQKVAALIDHFRIPTLRRPQLTIVRPEARSRLVEILESHPGVEPGLDDRL